MRVLILGAGGFVGSNIYEVLVHSSVDVVPGVRRLSSLAGVAKKSIGDHLVKNVSQLEVQDFSNFDTVIHCVLSDYSTYSSELLRTYRIAKKASVKQFIYISTIDVYDSFSIEDKSAEDSRLIKNGDLYGDTKIDAEKALLSEHSPNEDIKLTILRPGIIYGPKSKLWSYNIICRQLEGHWIDIQNDGIANLTYIEDLSRTVHFCIKNRLHGVHNVVSDSIKWKNFLYEHNRIVTKSEVLTKQQVGKLQHRTINILRGFAKSIFAKYKIPIMRLYTSKPFIRKLMKKVIAKLEAVPSDIETNVLNYPSRIINNNLKISEEYTPTEIGLKKTEIWYNKTGLIN